MCVCDRAFVRTCVLFQRILIHQPENYCTSSICMRLVLMKGFKLRVSAELVHALPCNLATYFIFLWYASNVSVQ